MAKEITILFEIDKLFKLVSLGTLYASNGVRDNVGATQEGIYAITENERDFFEIYLKTASDQVFSALRAYAKDVENSYQFNYVSGGKRNIKFMLSFPDQYDEDHSRVLYNLVETAITHYIIREWFRVKSLGDLSSVFDASYSAAMSNLNSNIHSRKIRDPRPYNVL